MKTIQLLLLSLLLTTSVFGSNYYFSSTTGDDTRTAAQAQNPATPWKSITKLNSVFATFASGDSILFKRGDVFYGALIIGKSGTASLPIILSAYGTGPKPIITGLSAITGFTNVGTNLWESPAITNAPAAVRMVLIDSVSYPMGRYPNVSAGRNGWLNYENSSGANSITDNQLSASPNWTGATVVVKKYNWIIDIGTVINHSGTTITWSNSNPDPCINGMSYFFENDIRTLDEYGEWYYNPTTKKITIYSPTAPLNVLVSTVNTVISGGGKSYYKLNNLAVSGSASDLISLGTSSTGVTITNCDISNAGKEAVYSLIGSSLDIENNSLDNTNNQGLMLDYGNNNITIRNNVLTNTGTFPGMTNQGITLFSSNAIHVYGDNLLIEGNRIINTGFNGVNFQGSNIMIRKNYIENFCMVKQDGGGIYTWTGNPSIDNTPYSNRVIENNIVVNGSNLSNIATALELEEPSVNGIYLDDYTKNVIIRGNSISKVNASGIYMNTPINVTIRGNTVFNARYASVHSNRTSTSPVANLAIFSNKFIARDSTQRTHYYLSESNDNTSNVTADSNYYARPVYDQKTISNVVYTGSYCGPGTPCGETKYTLAEWKTAFPNRDQNSKKSPVSITTTNDLRFEFNDTDVPKTIPLGATYVDVTNTVYAGSITLAPFTSAVLIRTSGAPLPNQAPTANAGADKNITLPVNTVTLTGSGTDPDGTIASFNWSKIAGPTTFTIAAPAQATTAINNLIQGTYQFKLTVTDNSGATATDTVNVTVNPAPNQAPVANAGADKAISLPTNTVTVTGSGTDADGTITTYAWTKIAGPVTFTIVSPNAASTVINNLVQGTYQFKLTVTDNAGASASDTMIVVVNAAANQLPVANAGSDLNITLPLSAVTVNGSGTDPDGTITTYAWTKIAGPATFTIVSPNAASTVINSLVQGTYQFKLTITDNAGASASDIMIVVVNPALNLPPSVNAGTDKVITIPVNTVTQTGSASDPDGTISTYTWTRIAGPVTFTIVSPNAASTVINNLVQGTYQFQLAVTDNSGSIARDTAFITVNVPPTVNAGADKTITLPTNTTTVTGIANDPDGTIASYTWTKIAGPATYTIVSPTASQTIINNLVQGVYSFELSVTDNYNAVTKDTVNVTVNPAANQAPVANAGADKTITLPVNSVSVIGSGTDVDGTITTYSWTKIAGPATYTIVSPANASTVISGLVQGSYQFQLTVTDNAGATGKDTMIVTVNPAGNQLPTANAGIDQNITLPLNTVTVNGSGSDPDGTITTYSWIKVSGPATFTIVSPNAAITVINNLVQGTYQFQLTVTDNAGATARDTVSINVNAAGNIAPTANAGIDQSITLPVNYSTVNGSGNDPDGTIGSYAWAKISGPATYTIVSPAAATTSITGLVQGTYQFQLTVTDNIGATGKDTIAITVQAANNQIPAANAGNDQNITLPVNTVTINGTGTDPDGTITSFGWAKIAGPATFNIVNPAAASTTINGLVQGTYQFQLTVTDNSGSTAKDTVVITVNPALNIPPVANAGTDKQITLPVNTVTLNGSGTDQDGNITSYAWAKIAGPAIFTIGSPASASTSVSALVQGTYQFQLTVTDNSGATGKDTVTLTVNAPANQAPVANAGSNQTITLPFNSITVNGSGADADGSITGYQWTKIGGSPNIVIVQPSSAQTIISNLSAGIYLFQLTVTDNNGATGKDTMQVTVIPAVPTPPVVNAGLDQSNILPANTATVTGSFSIDPDVTASSYLWTKISGPARYSIEHPDSLQTVISNLEQGYYLFELKVTDSRGSIGRDTLAIEVLQAPSTLVSTYPNPVNSSLNVTLNQQSGLSFSRITIYSMSGNPVIKDQITGSQSVTRRTFDVSRLASGTYVIEALLSNRKTETFKIIKQ